MGFAKYYEDDMSIYVGRLAVRDTVPVYHENLKRAPQKKVKAIHQESPKKLDSKVGSTKLLGRRGLELTIPNGSDARKSHTLQMNGWWWSKADNCWCNQNTKGNREFARGLTRTGATLRIIAD